MTIYTFIQGTIIIIERLTYILIINYHRFLKLQNINTKNVQKKHFVL